MVPVSVEILEYFSHDLQAFVGPLVLSYSVSQIMWTLLYPYVQHMEIYGIYLDLSSSDLPALMLLLVLCQVGCRFKCWASHRGLRLLSCHTRGDRPLHLMFFYLTALELDPKGVIYPPFILIMTSEFHLKIILSIR